jgi:hypothetical protein
VVEPGTDAGAEAYGVTPVTGVIESAKGLLSTTAGVEGPGVADSPPSDSRGDKVEGSPPPERDAREDIRDVFVRELGITRWCVPQERMSVQAIAIR